MQTDMKKTLHAVTGAFGYSGKYITKRLLDRGHEVITTTHIGFDSITRCSSMLTQSGTLSGCLRRPKRPMLRESST
jgi:nucleoside-diphosphate-sugar epimerase